jgi:S1-C subfamily serine protease
MKSGRSLSDRPARLSLRRAAAVLAFLAALAMLRPPSAARAQAIPPPPPNAGEEAKPQVKAPPPRPRLVSCPRCGYGCEPSWHYCLSCGWDRTQLTGEAEESALQTIARATLRVIVGGRPNRHGTAFPYGPGGLLVTNARLLVGAAEDRVHLQTWDNNEMGATIVAIDLPTGLALLKPEASRGPGLETAAADPAPPESAWAVCYPVEKEGDVVRLLPVSLHRGRLTATGESGTSFVSFEDLLRTDHSIEDGCTGGPLVDAHGKVAGMVLGRFDNGLSYALPLQRLRPVLDQMSRNEKPKWPYFGMGLAAPDDRRRQKFHLDASLAHPIVAYVQAGSPAEKAGVKPGDAIAAVGGKTVKTVWEAGSLLLAAAPGGTPVVFTLSSGGADRQVSIAPVERPARVVLDPVVELEETIEANLGSPAGGKGASRGLVVSDLVRGGRGEKAAWHNGDAITAVDKKSVDTPEDFSEAVRTMAKEVFSGDARQDKRYASSYFFHLEIRPEGKDKEVRDYINQFPDFLAPPVY